MDRMFKVAAASVNEVTKGLATIGHYLANVVLPPLCCLCADRAGAGLDLCKHCAASLPANLHAEDYPPIFSQALVPYSYAYPVDHCIRALKFKGERVYARVFGALLAEARMRAGAPLPEAIVPVPLHDARYKERGFNQAHDIARFAGRRLTVPVMSRCLVRRVATREQSGLPLAERVNNVRGVFDTRGPLPASHVALVDDVLTTGSTATEAARVFQRAGATHIELWAIAHVGLD